MKPGAKAFVAYQGKIMFVLRDNDPNIPYPDHWNLPGGGIEDGETPEQGLLREIEEEICLQPKRWRYLGSNVFPGRSITYRYLIDLDDLEAKQVKIGHEGQELGFFGIDELDDLRLTPMLKTYLLSIKVPLRALIEKGEAVGPEALGLHL